MIGHDRIVCEPDILGGKPSIKGTHTSVELILGWLALGWSFDNLMESYPGISRDDILAALAYAAAVVHEEGYLAMTEIAGVD